MRPRDVRGRDIHTGNLVAFNKSGNVYPGQVEKITQSGICHVRIPKDVNYWGGHLSKVRNPGSILVLVPGDVGYGPR